MTRPDIAVLAPEVVNQIAAGEVVTRPAAVVRELLDNAVDAGATDILIEIEKGGKKRILVRDDGIGMDHDSLKLAVLPHATSKIRSIDDLHNIRSLGFRGEALPSILAVSRLEILTAASTARSGHRLTASADKSTISPAAAPAGTSVSVRDLFWNVPARRKFLRSDTSETRAVTEVIIEHALAFPNLAFRYIRDGIESFALPAGETIADRVRELYDPLIHQAAIPFQSETASIRISGLATDPSVVKSTRSSMVLFVNGRRIQDSRLTHVILTVYREILDQGFPAVFMFLDINPHLVDVNVHPAKAEVRFSDPSIVYQAVSETLSGAIHRFHPSSTPTPESASAVAGGPIASPGAPEASPLSHSTDRPQPPNPSIAPVEPGDPDPALSPDPDFLQPAAAATLFPLVAGRFRVLGQIYKTFLLVEEIPAESSESADPQIWIVDQHVASERVLLARTTDRIESRGALSQALLVPLILELGLRDSILFERAAASLRRMGFEIEPFGPRGVWVVRAVPSILGRRVADRKVFLKFVEELSSFDMTRRSEEELFHDILAHFSCRAAIKAGDVLLPEEQSRLLSDLLSSQHFRICPHGRPSMIKLSKDELERRFLRK